MSHFRVVPCKCLQSAHGNLKKFLSAAKLVVTDTSDFHSVYGIVEEVLPKDLPKPFGKSATTIMYKDSN
jgi:hypothetical protein